MHAHLVSVALLQSHFIPYMQSITDPAPQNASHNANIEITAQEDLTASVSNVFRDIVVIKVGINTTRQRFEAGEIFLSERPIIKGAFRSFNFLSRDVTALDSCIAMR